MYIVIIIDKRTGFATYRIFLSNEMLVRRKHLRFLNKHQTKFSAKREQTNLPFW